MAQVTWSPKAVHQVDQIAEYIAQDSLFHANRVATLIVRSTRSLAQFPESGAVVPEFCDPDLREIRVYSYRIIYRFIVEEQEVRILAVVHGSRLIDQDSKP